MDELVKDAAYGKLDTADRLQLKAIIASFGNMSHDGKALVLRQLLEQYSWSMSPELQTLSVQYGSQMLAVLLSGGIDPYSFISSREKTEVCRRYATKFRDLMDFPDSNDYIERSVPPVRIILETYWIKNVENIFRAIRIIYKDLFKKDHRGEFHSMLLKLARLCCDHKLTQDQIDDLTEEKLTALKSTMNDTYRDSVLNLESLIKIKSL